MSEFSLSVLDDSNTQQSLRVTDSDDILLHYLFLCERPPLRLSIKVDIQISGRKWEIIAIFGNMHNDFPEKNSKSCWEMM